MISRQSSLDAVSGSHVQEDELTTTMDMKTLSQSLGGLGSEGSSGMSSGPVFRDSTSSKRLGSAESSSSDSSSSAPVFTDDNFNKEQRSSCSSCTTKDSPAVAKCFDCSSFLCASCVMAHQFVPRFEGHHVVILGEVANCFTGHDENEDLDVLTRVILEGKIKAKEISEDKILEATSFRLSSQYMKAVDEVNETYQFYIAMLQGRKTELLKELEQSFRSKQVALSVYGRKALETSNKIHQVTDFGDRLMKHASTSEILLFKKPIETRLHQLLAYMPILNTAELTELEFISNFQAIQEAVRHQFGYVKAKQEIGGFRQQPPIGRPAGSPSEESQSVNSLVSPPPMNLTGGHFDQVPQTLSDSISPIKKMYEDASFIANTHSTPANVTTGERKVYTMMPPNPLDKNISTSLTHFSSTPIKPTASSLLAPLLNSSNELSSLLKGSYMEDRSASPYDKWANSSDNLFSGLAVGSNNQAAASYGSSLLAPSSGHVASLPYLGLSSNFPSNFSSLGSQSLANTKFEFNFPSNFSALGSQPLANISPSDYISPTDLTSIVYPTPTKSHIKRQKMIYHCKFGYSPSLR